MNQAPIELLDRHAEGLPAGVPKAPAGRPPLLFVHGGFCGAWVWDEFFLPWFAARGWRAAAVNLRGHGPGANRHGLHSASLSDYADDVLRASQQLGSNPILIGHSMGGMVVQRVMSRVRVPAAVLMATVPAHGLAAPVIATALRTPALLDGIGAAMRAESAPSMAQSRRWLFSDALSHADAMRHLSRMRGESSAVLNDLMSPLLAWQFPRGRPPVLVMGAEQDPFVSPGLLRSTARRLGGDLRLFDDVGHTMMLDVGWEHVASVLLGWLTTHVERPRAHAA